MRLLIAILLLIAGAVSSTVWHYTDIGCNEVHLTGDGPSVHVVIQDNGGIVLFQSAFPAHYFAHGATIPVQANSGFFVITVYHRQGHKVQYFMNHVWEQCGLVR